MPAHPRPPRRLPRRALTAGIVLALLVLVPATWAIARLTPAAADPLPPMASPMGSSTASERGDSDAGAAPAGGGWQGLSYVQPSDALVYEVAQARAGADASPAEIAQAAARLRADWEAAAYHGPDPVAGASFQAREARLLQALARGESPASAFDRATGSADGQVADGGDATDAPDLEGLLRLFVVAVEFAGEDKLEDYAHPVSISDRTCVTDTLPTYTGPLHNTIPEPSPNDNETFWLDTFDQAFYDKLIFSEEGISERPRMDMTDPEDGQPGIDFSGLTMTRFYDEVSGGKVRFDGGPKGVMAWVQVPHSVAWYAGNRCVDGNAGRIQSMNGLPGNPRFPNGVSSLAADVVDAINAADPDFPWADYDLDKDNEIDHVILIHAGIDKSDGGGEYGWQQIWAHRGSVDGRQGGYLADDGGTPDDPADDVRLRGYTIQPENLYLGVLVHEFGHDLGLPDLYDTGGAGRNSVAWWDLMSLGSRSGRLNGSDPTHLSTRMKMVLDWSQPRVITPTEDAETYVIGQNSGPPAGTDPSLLIEIPPSVVPDVRPQGGKQVWSSGYDQNWADSRLTRELDLSAVAPGTPVTLSFDLAYQTQTNRDFFFVEVSADAGASFTQTQGYRADTGELLTTPADYPDPNGRLATYGKLRYGYMGNSDGWLRVRHDLSPWAGQAIRLRLRYATDNSGLAYGAYVDNFRIQAAADTLLDDPVENDDPMGWQSQPGTFTDTEGLGWQLSDGARRYARYYILEWRSTNGFDRGLKYAYNTIYSRQTDEGRRELRVDHLPTNAPGLLVWVWDTRFGSNNNTFDDNRFRALPSEGAKGGVMVLDAHPEPIRGPLGGKIENAFGRFDYPPDDNWDGRVLTADSAFNLLPTALITLTASSGGEKPATTVVTPTLQGGLPAAAAFHDALSHSSAVELLPAPVTLSDDGERQRIKRYAFSDPDGGLVVPAAGYYAPRTPAGFTGLGAEQSPPSADVSTEETLYVDRAGQIYTISVGIADEQEVQGEHSGNPGDVGLHFGFHFEVVDQAADGTQGSVRIWRNPWAAELDATASVTKGDIAVDVGLRNVGGAGDMLLFSDFDEDAAEVDPDYAQLPEGAVFVGIEVDAESALAALRRGEPLTSLRAVPEDGVAVAWVGRLASGAEQRLAYRLRARSAAPSLNIRSLAYALTGSTAALAVHDLRLEWGSRLYLPGLWNQESTR